MNDFKNDTTCVRKIYVKSEKETLKLWRKLSVPMDKIYVYRPREREK